MPIGARRSTIKMNIKTFLLPGLFESVLQLLTEHKYSKRRLAHYRCTYNQLKKYLDKRGIDIFTEEVGMDFINHHYGEENKLYVDLKLCITRLVEVHENRFLSVRRYVEPKKELKYLKQSFEIYKNLQHERILARRTIETKCYQTKEFFLFLEDLGIHTVSDITVEAVYDYLNEKKAFAVSTKETMLYTLRDFFRSFVDMGLCKESLARLFPQISTHAESPVPSCFTPQEMRTILASVDRSDVIGKRDYAMLLLACLLGIRTGDIRAMKLCHIKWGNGTIEFTQSKTGRYLQLPMPQELKLALLDYLKNARPKSQLDCLFVKMVAPYGTYSSHSTFGYILRKYLNDIDLNGRKHGMHSLRFSAAGNMLSEGVGITTICNILGHSYSDTTKDYLKIDIMQLRKAALEVAE